MQPAPSPKVDPILSLLISEKHIFLEKLLFENTCQELLWKNDLQGF